jgi:hypothetical protein
MAVSEEEARDSGRIRREDKQQRAIERSVERQEIGPRETDAASENGGDHYTCRSRAELAEECHRCIGG